MFESRGRLIRAVVLQTMCNNNKINKYIQPDNVASGPVVGIGITLTFDGWLDVVQSER